MAYIGQRSALAIGFVLQCFASSANASLIISGDGNETCSLPSAASCTVAEIDPASVWVNPDPLGNGATWISYADTGRPGTVTAPPGYVATFFESFSGSAGDAVHLEVWADNWVNVFLNGDGIFTASYNAMFQPGAQAVLDFVVGSDGFHTLSFEMYQDGTLESPPGNPFGLMYSGDISPISQVPEPGPIWLFATALGLAGLGFSRRRKSAQA